MTEETKDVEKEAGDQSGNETDWKVQNDELHGRIARLEDEVAARESELAGLKESLSGAVAKYRAAVLASAPGIPDELVEGSTVEEIDACLEQARGIVSKVRQQLETEATARSVPAGSPPRTGPDIESLSGEQQIAHALKQESQKR